MHLPVSPSADRGQGPLSDETFGTINDRGGSGNRQDDGSGAAAPDDLCQARSPRRSGLQQCQDPAIVIRLLWIDPQSFLGEADGVLTVPCHGGAISAPVEKNLYDLQIAS